MFFLFGFWFSVFGLLCRHTASNLITFWFLVCYVSTHLAKQLQYTFVSKVVFGLKVEFLLKTYPKDKRVTLFTLSLSRSFVLTLFFCKTPNYMLARTLTERVVYPGTKPNPDPHPPRGCLSNSLGPVWANMYLDPLSTTTPAAVGIDSPDCVCVLLWE